MSNVRNAVVAPHQLRTLESHLQSLQHSVDELGACSKELYDGTDWREDQFALSTLLASLHQIQLLLDDPMRGAHHDLITQVRHNSGKRGMQPARAPMMVRMEGRWDGRAGHRRGR
jgi:hypothetical protein